MAIGPVQLLVVGFSHPRFEGEIRSELDLVAVGLVGAAEAEALAGSEDDAL